MFEHLIAYIIRDFDIADVSSSTEKELLYEHIFQIFGFER